MSHVLPNISRGRFFEPIFTSKKFDLYTSIYGNLDLCIVAIVKVSNETFPEAPLTYSNDGGVGGGGSE